MYWAYNKKTNQRYGPYTEAEKSAFQSTPSTNVYRWEEIEEVPAPPAAVKPTNVKAATTKKEVETKKATKPKRRTTKKGAKDDSNS